MRCPYRKLLIDLRPLGLMSWVFRAKERVQYMAETLDAAGTAACMKGTRVLILGDMVADIYLDGRISRISREAPVLVLEEMAERVVAGGAANVAHNAATLGGRVKVFGVLGRDAGGDGIRTVLDEAGVDTAGLVRTAERPTISKTRVIAGGRATVSQQIVRIDKESREPLPAPLAETLMASLLAALPSADAVVLSDYGSGTITEEIRTQLLAACRRQGMPSIVDSRYSVRRFKGVDYVKQNDAELAAAFERHLETEEDIERAARELIGELGAKGALITRGEKGMLLFLADGARYGIPVSDKSEVYDVSGAGDTCVAAFILALAGGTAPQAAAHVSNIASGIAVRKLGTAAVSAEELQKKAKELSSC